MNNVRLLYIIYVRMRTKLEIIEVTPKLFHMEMLLKRSVSQISNAHY